MPRRAPTSRLLAAILIVAGGAGFAADAEARARHHLVNRHVRPVPHRPPPRHVHHTRTVVVAPVRAVPAVRPAYWGSVVAGVTIGAVVTAAAVNSAPRAPSPDLCWFWTDSSRTRGYWNYCVAPVRP